MTTPGGSHPSPYDGPQQGYPQQGYPQQNYPQQGYPPPYAAGPPRKSGLRRAGAWMFFIGLPLLLLGAVLLIVGFGRAVGSFDPADFDSPTVEVAGPTAVVLAAGETRSLSASSTATDVTTACTVTSPGGPVPIAAGEVFGQPLPNLANFTATESGEHVIDCAVDGVVVGPELDPANIAGAGLAMVGGLALAALGGLLALIGAIMWLVGRSRDKAARGY